MTSIPNSSLREETEELRRHLRAGLGDRLDGFDAEAEALGRRRFATPRLGERAPSFTLPDAAGRKLSLDTLCAGGPLVLLFYRGSWCPYCNLQLRAFQRRLPDIAAAGASLVAISPQNPDVGFAEREALAFPILTDAGNVTARAYGLVYAVHSDVQAHYRAAGVDLPQLNGDLSWELPAPATFVIHKDGIIASVSLAADYRWRVGPEEVLKSIRGGGTS